MKKLLTAISCLIPIGAAYANDCVPAHEFETRTPGVLVHAAVTYMPYSAIDENGQATGVDGEILKAIAKKECLTLKTIPVDSAAAMNYVISGRADLTTGGYYRTAARAKVVDLSDPLYVDQMAIITKSGVSSFDELEGMSTGVIQGDLWVSDLKKVLGRDLKPYPALSQLIQDVDSGRLDALITGYSVAVIAQQQGQLQGMEIMAAEKDTRVGASVNAGQGAFPMSKRNEGMLKAFNENIAELHENGTIKAILEKYSLDASASETGAPRLLN